MRCTMCTIDFIPDKSKVVEDENSHTGFSRKGEDAS